jgi:hypothetical protein
LWIAFANTDGNGGHIGNAYGNRDSYGYGNGDCIGNAYGNRNSYRGAEAYADAQAASYTAASALRSALAHVSSGGLAINSRVPVTRTTFEGIASSSEKAASRMSQRGARVAPAVISKLSGPLGWRRPRPRSRSNPHRGSGSDASKDTAAGSSGIGKSSGGNPPESPPPRHFRRAEVIRY